MYLAGQQGRVENEQNVINGDVTSIKHLHIIHIQLVCGLSTTNIADHTVTPG